ncbi:MAG: hypothetical protein E6J93_00545 [Methanobacteriota archaeon]|nr:MAG: hypothetical protein E6J93_00545 [Euryarchaeota archaeon]
MAFGTFWMIDLVLAGASIAVLIGLLYIYVGNYRGLRSPFSAGLIVFAALFLVENLAAMYFYVAMSEWAGAGVAVPMLALNAAELVGFATLLYVSWR